MLDLSFWADIATVVGVIVVIYQVWQLNKTSRTTFEDGLNKEYRDLVSRIPVDVLMGMSFRDIPDKRKCGVKGCEVRERIYNYLDLCNEQVYLRKVGRVSKKCWENWRAGIEDNLSSSRPCRSPRPAFKEVWDEVKNRDRCTFSHLKQLEDGEFRDPKPWWVAPWC